MEKEKLNEKFFNNYYLNKIYTTANTLEMANQPGFNAYKKNLACLFHTNYIKENDLTESNLLFFNDVNDIYGYTQKNNIFLNQSKFNEMSIFEVFSYIVHEQQHVEQCYLNQQNSSKQAQNIHYQTILHFNFSDFILSVNKQNNYATKETQQLFNKLEIIKNNYFINISSQYGNLPWEVDARQKQIEFLQKMHHLFPHNKNIINSLKYQQKHDIFLKKSSSIYSFLNNFYNFYKPAKNAVTSLNSTNNLDDLLVNNFIELYENCLKNLQDLINQETIKNFKKFNANIRKRAIKKCCSSTKNKHKISKTNLSLNRNLIENRFSIYSTKNIEEHTK